MANSFLLNGCTTHENQSIFLNTNLLVGVQEFSASYTNTNKELKYLGLDRCRYISDGPQIGQASINSLLITNDQLLQLTGHTGCNIYAFKNPINLNDNFSCISGYCTSYSIRGSVNQIPEISVSLSIFGDVGRVAANIPQTAAINNQITNDFAVIPSVHSTLPLKIASFNSTTINISDFVTNRIQSFDLTVVSNRLPIYSLGSKYVTRVELMPPQQVIFNCAIELNDYHANRIRDYPFSESINDLTLTIKDYNDGSLISNYSFKRMIKISENYTTNTVGPVILNLGYQGYYT